MLNALMLSSSKSKGVVRSLQTKYLKGSNYYNSKLFQYFPSKFFNNKFFILQNVIPQIQLPSIKKARPSFGHQNKHNGK